MKTYALIAALALALPGVADARKVTYYSDRDRDGHYVKRTKNVPDYRHRGYYGSRNYGHRHYGSRYGRSYFGRPYYYSSSPYYYGGYSPYYYGSPGLSFTYSSSPRYYRTYRSVPTYRSTVSSLEVDVQRELRRHGYYRGPIDGDIGPGSRNAIRAYQADRGLSVTGRIDSRLLRSLGI